MECKKQPSITKDDKCAQCKQEAENGRRGKEVVDCWRREAVPPPPQQSEI